MKALASRFGNAVWSAVKSKEARRGEIAVLIIVLNSVADEFGVQIPFDQIAGWFS